MTDPTGRSFLSYRRTRLHDARLLIEAQRDVGIPTWQDLDDLGAGHADDLLRKELAGDAMANAVCLLTPDVADSPVITRTEIPAVLERTRQKDGFFMQPIAAGGLEHADVPNAVGSYVGTHDVGQWNVLKLSSDPLTAADAASVAHRILRQRVVEIHKRFAEGEPLRLILNTRTQPAFERGFAFLIDWYHRFDGRVAKPGAWDQHLLPSLAAVAGACERHAPGRAVIAGGQCALPAAAALGVAFPRQGRVHLDWLQRTGDRLQVWSVRHPPEPSGFVADVQNSNPNGDDLMLLVSVTSPVEEAFGASRPRLPAPRCIVTVTKPGNYPHDIETPGQASDIVRIVREALISARQKYQPRGGLHLFMAVPVGLAVMIGQSLNTYGSVQTYEHIPGGVGHYEPAALLTP